MQDLILHKLRTDPSLDDVKIDDNWDMIEVAYNALRTAAELGAVYIVSASVEGGLSFTLSNGTVIGPLPFTGVPIRALGPWQAGFSYQRGDFIINADSWGMARVDFDAGESYQDDVNDEKIAALPLMGGADAGPKEVQFGALGPVANSGEKLIAQHIVTAPCRLTSDMPILGAITTPISSGGAPLQIIVRRVQMSGAVSEIATITFMPGFPATQSAINAELAFGDGLQIVQIDGDASTGAANWQIALRFAPPAA